MGVFGRLRPQFGLEFVCRINSLAEAIAETGVDDPAGDIEGGSRQFDRLSGAIANRAAAGIDVPDFPVISTDDA